MSRDNIVDKSAKTCNHTYKAGDRVRVIQNTSDHDIPIGTVVTLTVMNRYKTYWNTDWRGSGDVYPQDIEPVETNKKEEYTVPEGYKWHTCTITYSRAREHGWSDSCLINCGYLIPLQEEKNPVTVNAQITLPGTVKQINVVGTLVKDETNQQTKGDLNMSNTQRRVVNVVLIDPDQGLPVELSQVHDFGQIVAEDSSDVVIQELLMTGDVQAKLDIHNKVRSEQVDLDILKRTGNEVMLQPVKLKQLQWVIK